MQDFIVDHIGKIVGLILILLIISIPIFGEAGCKAKTKGMGFNYDWSFLGGCRVEYKPGKWVPIERYRVEG